MSQEEINRCNDRRMQEALWKAGTGSRRVWREQWQSRLGCIWVTHRKVRGFAEVTDQIGILFGCMIWSKHLMTKGLSIRFFRVVQMGIQKHKFGDKLAALPQSRWRFCLALTVYVKNLPEQVLSIMKRQSVLQQLTQHVGKETQWDWAWVVGQH